MGRLSSRRDRKSSETRLSEFIDQKSAAYIEALNSNGQIGAAKLLESRNALSAYQKYGINVNKELVRFKYLSFLVNQPISSVFR